MPSAASSSSSQSPVWRFQSSVREALVTSVAWSRAPPVSFQSSQESTVPKASRPASAAARAPGSVVEDPGELGAGEVGVEHEARALAEEGLEPGALQPRRRRRPCGGPARRWRCRAARPVRAVPDHRGLPLVGDAEGGHVAGGEPGPAPGPPGPTASCDSQISSRVVLHPARTGKDLPEFALGHGRRPSRSRRRRWRASWWSPGRGRGRRACGATSGRELYSPRPGVGCGVSGQGTTLRRPQRPPSRPMPVWSRNR